MQFRSLAMAALLGAAQAVDVQVVYVGTNPANNVTGSKFWPESITAEPGSMVQFQFWTGNHTVTQSSFDSPCSPMEATAPASNGTVSNGTLAGATSGIKSGFMPVDASMPDGSIPVYTIMINDTSPLWFYCGQGSHCADGMAMVINPASEGDKTLEAYKEVAAASGEGGVANPGDDTEGSDDSEGGAGGDSGSGEGSDGGSGDGSGDNPDEVPSGEDDAATIGDGAGSGASALSLSSSLLLGLGAAALLL